MNVERRRELARNGAITRTDGEVTQQRDITLNRRSLPT